MLVASMQVSALESLSIPEAIEVFGKGFSYTRSFTHPYEFARIDPLWVMQDAPRKKGPYRGKELIVHGLEPFDAVEAVQRIAPDSAVCVIEDLRADHLALKEAYKSLGYRLIRREPLMAKYLGAVNKFESPYPIIRVDCETMAERVKCAARSRQILPSDISIGDSRLRLYAALEEHQPIGWVRSVRTGPNTAWVSNMYVRPDRRRKGIGKALMSAMLQDDHRFGVRFSVLLASDVGSKLYPNLGYEQIGLLQLFVER